MNRPRRVHTGSSWLVRPESHRFIFDWTDAFLRGYGPIGRLKFRPGGSATFLRGDREPQSQNWSRVFERRG